MLTNNSIQSHIYGKKQKSILGDFPECKKLLEQQFIKWLNHYRSFCRCRSHRGHKENLVLRMWTRALWEQPVPCASKHIRGETRCDAKYLACSFSQKAVIQISIFLAFSFGRVQQALIITPGKIKRSYKLCLFWGSTLFFSMPKHAITVEGYKEEQTNPTCVKHQFG